MSERDYITLKNWVKYWPVIVLILQAVISFTIVKANIGTMQAEIDKKVNKSEVDANINTVDQKLNMIILNQNELIKRFDRHIDKDGR